MIDLSGKLKIFFSFFKNKFFGNICRKEKVPASFLLSIGELISDSMALISPSYEVILVNARFKSIFDRIYDVEVDQGLDFINLLPEDDRDQWKKTITDELKGHEKRKNITIHKGTVYADFEISSIYHSNRIAAFLIASKGFVSNEKNLKLIWEQQETFKVLTENIRIAIFTFDEHGYFTYVNPYMKKITGYTEKELYNHKFYDIIHPDHRDIVKIRGMKRISGNLLPKNYELKIQNKQGEIVWVEISNSRITLNGENFVLGTAQEITDRKKAEEQLKVEQAYLENLFNFSPEAIVVTTNSGIVQSINKEFTDLFGYTEKEAIGEKIDELIAPLEQRGEASEKTNTVAKGERVSDESIRMCKDGTIIHVSILGAPVMVDDEQKAVYGIYRNISDRVESEKQMKEAKEKAEESDRLKSFFLANMSHEIRTPMNAILGFSKFLKEPDLSEKHRSEYVDIINNRGNHLLHIIDDILDLSKIEAGELNILEREFNLNQLLDEMYSVFRNDLDQRGKEKLCLHLSKELDEEEATIKADKQRLQQILSNLLKNAVKYTNSGYIEFGYVLQARKDKTNLEFFVKDTGIGISEDKKRVVFDRFRQSDDSKERQYGGAGLGLSISKALVEKMQGKIWMESELNKGSVFYFTLPLNQHIRKNDLSEQSKQSEDKTINYRWENRKILIVEDDMISYKFLEAILKDTGSKLLSAKNAREAINVVKNEKVDVVLMDIQLPGKNGNEATSQIKKINKNIPVIAQTAHAMENDKQKSLEAGCDDYITKPINMKILLNSIANQLKRYNK